MFERACDDIARALFIKKLFFASIRRRKRARADAQLRLHARDIVVREQIIEPKVGETLL